MYHIVIHVTQDKCQAALTSDYRGSTCINLEELIGDELTNIHVVSCSYCL